MHLINVYCYFQHFQVNTESTFGMIACTVDYNGHPGPKLECPLYGGVLCTEIEIFHAY